MRKWLLGILVMLCLVVSVSAAETVTLEEAGITLTIPDGYDVAYRGMPEDHPYLAKYGETIESVQQMLDENRCELVAIQASPVFAVFGVNYYSLEEIYEMDYRMAGGQTLAYELALWEWFRESEYNIDVDAQYVQIGETPFQRFVCRDTEGRANCSGWDSYETIQNGVRYTFSLMTSEGPLSELQQTEVRNIMESVTFLKECPEPEPVSQIAYDDDGMSLKISHPSTWSCQTVEDDISNYLELIPQSDPDTTLRIFETASFFKVESEEEAETCDMDVFLHNMDEAALKEWLYEPDVFGLTYEVKYGGIQYLLCQCEYIQEGENFSFSNPVVVLLHLRDNVLYEIWYYGTTDDPYYPDVKTIASNMVFRKTENTETVVDPNPDTAVKTEEEPEPELTVSDTDEDTIDTKWLSRRIVRLIRKLWVFVVAGFGWVVAKVRKKLGLKDKTPAPEKVRVGHTCPKCHKEVIPGQSFCTNCGKELRLPVEEPTAEQVTYVCPKCGKTVSPGQAFCHHCGQRMNWEKVE